MTPMCSECGHEIAVHFPNFKDGKPISTYCAGACSCVRDAAEIEWLETQETEVVGPFWSRRRRSFTRWSAIREIVAAEVGTQP